MKKKLNLAIIGCGNIAKYHIEAFNYLGLKIEHCASKLNSTRVNKFARKFGLYNFDDEKISIYADGYLDLTRSRLKLKKVVRDRSQLIGKSQITILEKSLNENVLNEGVLGILDFFKFKKFFQEVL